jgi:hypothetical protein
MERHLVIKTLRADNLAAQACFDISEVFLKEAYMKNKVLGLALAASMLFGVQQLAVAAPLAAPTSPAGISLGHMSAAEPVYYARRSTVVRGGRGHACAGGRRCVGGFYRGVCRTWAACR